MLSVSGNEADEAQGAAHMRAAAHHGEELLHFLRRRVRCPEDAADLRQEALLRMNGAAPGAVHNIRAYLFQVARNLIVDRARTKAAEMVFAAPALAIQSVPCETPGPDLQAESASDLSALRRAVAALPERQRLALLWSRLDGLTLHEIAERLDVSESMAGRYVRDALARCQAMLDGQ